MRLRIAFSKHGKIRFTPLAEFPTLVEPDKHRPREQAWLALQPVADVMAGPGTPDRPPA